MKNKIMDYLMISSKYYDDMVYQTYFIWCHKRASSDSKLQELLSNSAVNKWFLKMYTKLEQQFVELYEHFPTKLSDPEYHYKSCITEIYAIFPMDLISGFKVNENYSFKLNENTTIYAN